MITNSRGTLHLVNALVVSAEVTTQGGGSSAPAASSGTLIFDNFAPGSAALTAKHRAKLKSTAKASAGFKTMVCIGYTMGPTVLKADKILSMNRANNVCAALHKLVPSLAIVKSTGVTETGVGGSVRRVEVTFKN
jgi:outer membrane protein OmpA-like peptidoglycan-associated protein